MADFLEERLSEDILLGSSWQDEYSVQIVTTAGGQEYRSLRHPYPVRVFDVSYMLERADMWTELLNVYARAHGTFAGFRAKCYDDYSSNGATGTPTAFDQACVTVTAGSIYQLAKSYGTDKSAGSTGYAYRLIQKPVSGSVLVGIGATAIRSADWSVVTTTGRVTFAADVTKSITGISKAAQAQITVGSHSFVSGQSVQISGVAGMTQINAQRALITTTDATTITVAIDSSAYSTYSSGGVVHTRPQSGEVVTAGYTFDMPVRFDTVIPVGQDYPGWRPVDGVKLRELLNP